MNESEGRRRFRELLPWHVNGTLGGAERGWVEDYARAHPEASAELRWCESLQADVRGAVPEVAPELGLDRLMARIHAERRDVSAPGLLARLRVFVADLRFSPVAAVAATLVLAQAGIIGTLLFERQVEQERFGSARSLDSGALVVIGSVVQVSFRADITEREMRELLVEIDGTLVGGPGQLGNYVVAVPEGKVEQAARTLGDSPLVEDVSVLPHLPPRQ